MKQLIIIGGGAAGLAAALSARKCAPRLEITVLERLDRVGKKILATGNGRCKLTNSTAAPSHYYSSSWPRLKEAMADMDPKQVLAFF